MTGKPTFLSTSVIAGFPVISLNRLGGAFQSYCANYSNYF